jgi:endonuclease-3
MVRILDRLGAEFKPWRPERKPFLVLVWTVLSQNTNDRNTKMAFDRLIAEFKTPKQIAKTNVKAIQKLIKPAGLHQAKSRHLKELAQIIIAKYKGDLSKVLRKPTEEARRELLALPGIGYKTADVLLVFAAGRDVVPVDTHVARVSKRLGFAAPTDNREGVRGKLMEVISHGRKREAHVLLIQHGRRYCKARKPLCDHCPVNDLCPKLGL